LFTARPVPAEETAVKLPEQVTRLGIVILVVVAIVLSLRLFILPPDWFSAKPHQAAKVEREMAKPMSYAGVTTCRKCHDEEFAAKYAGYHRNISCENCHGPAAAHAANRKDKSLYPRRPKDREFCLACHTYDTSRPNGFPQIDPLDHYSSKQCVRCHDPHDPTPEEPVKECSGCHGRITHMKDRSTHGPLACAECHQVEDTHLAHPRTSRPSKPDTRESCGRCHAEGSTDPAVAKALVDMDSHGGTRVCWECHYAHLPEGSK
jgi:hypothetical protein